MWWQDVLARLRGSRPRSSAGRSGQNDRIEAGPKVILGVDGIPRAPNWDIADQSRCPLYGRLPAELRKQILIETLTMHPDRRRAYPRSARYCRPGSEGPTRYFIGLLLTCRAVYVEACLINFQHGRLKAICSGLRDISPEFGIAQSERNVWIASWMHGLTRAQVCVLKTLDVTLQQLYLESGILVDLRLVMNDLAATRRDGDMIVMRRGRFSISRLIIRLHRTDWWSWTDPPTAGLPDSWTMAIDPCYGTGQPSSRCVPSQMVEAARRRSSGEVLDPAEPGAWGPALVRQFPELDRFEMVLETWQKKEDQLDQILDCAKTWTFPLRDGFELRQSGPVETLRWQSTEQYDYNNAVPWAIDLVDRDASDVPPPGSDTDTETLSSIDDGSLILTHTDENEDADADADSTTASNAQVSDETQVAKVKLQRFVVATIKWRKNSVPASFS